MPGITWNQAVEDALSMIVQGFSVQEIVTMRDPIDGTIRLQGLFPRSQETILEWEYSQNGDELLGAWQTPPEGGARLFIPLSKMVHYKTSYARGNPEGRSCLRNAYQPYHFAQSINISEAIGVERDLTGLPIITAPAAFLTVGGNRAALEKIGRDIRLNDQSSLVMDSDTFATADGSPSSVKKFDIKLLSAEGNGKVDTDKIIKRHEANIARTLLADFLILGSDGKGSYSLSTDKTEIFIRAIGGFVKNICETIERQLIPVLWKMNGFPDEMRPCMRPGTLAPIDLLALGDFLSKITGAGFQLNDLETEEHIRKQAGLPPKPTEDPPEPIDDPKDLENPEDNIDGQEE